jgi:peptidoglycan/LPS O-acetylase OafA/YrhL
VYLSQYSLGRDNNFNLLRFIAASLVLFSHSFALSTGSASAEPLRDSLGVTWGHIAVDLFFVTSGFLVTGSLLVRKKLAEYVAARALRILPGLWVALGLTVFVLGAWVTTLGLKEYFSHPDTWIYLFQNATLLKASYTLPGVFEDLPWKRAVNGSLWTLPLEVRMYAALALSWLVARWLIGESARNFSRICLAAAILAACAQFILVLLGKHHPAIQLGYMFFAGAVFRLLQDRIDLSPRFALLMFLEIVLASMNKTAFGVVYALCMPYLILYLAFVPRGAVRGFNRLGDYSYGIYIYAFPVQQLLAFQWRGINPYEMMALSFVLTLMLAIASWTLIEKRSLAMKPRFQRRE